MDHTSANRPLPASTRNRMAKERLKRVRAAIEAWAPPNGDDAGWVGRNLYGIRRCKFGGAMLISVSGDLPRVGSVFHRHAEAWKTFRYYWLFTWAVAVPDTPAYRHHATYDDGMEGPQLDLWWLLVALDGTVTEIPPRKSVENGASRPEGHAVAAGAPGATALAERPPPPEARAATNATFWLPPRQSSMRSDTTA